MLCWRLWMSSVKNYSFLCVGIVYYVFCEIGARVTTIRRRCLSPYLLCWFRTLIPAFCLLPPSLSFPLMCCFLCFSFPSLFCEFHLLSSHSNDPLWRQLCFCLLVSTDSMGLGAAATPDLPESHDKRAQMHLKCVFLSADQNWGLSSFLQLGQAYYFSKSQSCSEKRREVVFLCSSKLVMYHKW